MVSIPFNRPYAGRSAESFIGEALRSAHHSGDGTWAARVTTSLADMTGGGRVFLTPSGTDALELACMTAGIGPGDEVIVPSFTFSSTATAPQRQGAVVRFADIDPISLGLDPAGVAALVNDRTAAIITVHYAGQATNIEGLRALAASNGLVLIEDAAHALGGSVGGEPFGSFGQLACLSFHETKNLSCGEGGAIVVNDPDLVETVEKMREKGTDRSRFFRGQVDKYTWVSPGSSFLLGEVPAAMLAAGLEDWELTQAARQAAWERYASGLSGFAQRTGWALHPGLTGNAHPAHLFYLLAPSGAERDAMLVHCRANDVLAVSHYQPLAESEEGLRASAPYVDHCPVSTDVSCRLLRLPLFGSITSDEVDQVIATLEAGAP